MNNFNKAFEKVILLEGGYSNNPFDSGGETKWGITKQVARNHGFKWEMKDLPISIAKDIYKASYWDVNRLDELLDERIQYEIFDTGVNCGTKMAAKFLQESYNLLSDDSSLSVDGIIGSKTIEAINSYNKKERIYTVLNALQAEYYLQITRKREKNKKFIFGWLSKRVF